MAGYRPRLHSRIYLSIICLFFISCEQELVFDNPLDQINNPDYIPPDTFITVDELADSTINNSSVTITWVGNDMVIEYATRHNEGEWSGWSADTSLTLNYLDEGQHSFSVKGRYATLDEDPTPASVIFTVDNIHGPAIRVYKLMTEMSVDSTQDIHIYAEEVTGLVVARFQVQYDPSLLDLDTESVLKGDLYSDIEEILFIVEEIGSGILDVNLSTLSHNGISGTGALIKLPFTAVKAGSSDIEILNPQFRDINGDELEVNASVNGMVIIQ